MRLLAIPVADTLPRVFGARLRLKVGRLKARAMTAIVTTRACPRGNSAIVAGVADLVRVRQWVMGKPEDQVVDQAALSSALITNHAVAAPIL